MPETADHDGRYTQIDAGYVSRVLAFLETEALIKRVGHGRTERRLAGAPPALGNRGPAFVTRSGVRVPGSSQSVGATRAAGEVDRTVRGQRGPRRTGTCTNCTSAPRDGYAAPSQVAVDLLTNPGRGPAEGEELIDWMRSHEEVFENGRSYYSLHGQHLALPATPPCGPHRPPWRGIGKLCFSDDTRRNRYRGGVR